MIDANIPHNLLVTDEGMTVYVIPRKFDMLLEVNFFTSFESVCGFVKFKTAQGFEGANEDDVRSAFAEVSLSDAEFGDLKKSLVSKFSKEYECDVLQALTNL